MNLEKKYLNTLAIILLLHLSIFSQELINVGIFTSSQLSSIKILFSENYSAQIDNLPELHRIDKGQFYQIEAVQDSFVLLTDNNGQKTKAKKINFFSPDIKQSQFTILTNHHKKERTYKGHLNITAINGNLKLINTLELDEYVCGVVNAEVGKGRHPEFYKAQVLLIRTYALSHLYKHLPEGFNLCDQVHCQVYYGICQSSIIADAVQQTHDEVIVDKDLNLIVAAFHSNSGGETVNSEDIWGSKKDYLRSVNDTFSVGMPSYYWQKQIPVKAWLDYLKKYKYPVNDSEAINYALNFKQYKRLVYLQYRNIKIPLKDIRNDWKLMSTFFDISPNNTRDTIILKGKGFGHGVGLSQEGAMKMAKLGYNYKDIIHYYFQNVILMDLKKLNFFKNE